MIKKILISSALVVGIIVLLITGSLIRQNYINKTNQELMQKSDGQLIGKRLEINRNDKKSVSVNIYTPKHSNNKKIPIIFNIHGGAFISGDADTLDTQSERLSNMWNVVVVTIDYTLANKKSIEYGVEEVTDTVHYFEKNATKYNLDHNKFVMLGYSAGAYYALASTIQLKKQNFDIAAQVLCYPFIRDATDLFNSLNKSQKNIAPALFVLSGNDPISDGSLVYERKLKENNVNVSVIKFEQSKHGFIEENNPEYNILKNINSKSKEQEKYARQAENQIDDWLKNTLN